MRDQEGLPGIIVRQHDIGAGGSVSVAVGSQDVRVRGIDGTIVRLIAPVRDDPLVETAAEPGLYAVRVGRSTRGRGFGLRLGGHAMFGLEIGGGGTVEIEVPRDARLEISSGSGDVSVRDLVGSVAVRTVSGDVSLRGGGGDLHVETASGSLRAVAAAPLEATVRTISGDVEIEAPRMERTGITTVSGDVEIASVFAPAGDHLVSTTSGDVDLAVRGGVTIDARTVSGDVEVTHPDGRARDRRREPVVIGDGAARLTVRTLSGDIEIRPGRARPDRDAVPGPALAPLAAESSTPPNHPIPPRASPAIAGGAGSAAPPASDAIAILEALASGEIDVAEAERRLGGGAADRG